MGSFSKVGYVTSFEMLSFIFVGFLAVPGVVHAVNSQLSRPLFVTLAMASRTGLSLSIICSGMVVVLGLMEEGRDVPG